MEKTLQQQYNLIKEGKWNKDDFLKSARRVFPEYIAPLTDYNTAVNILKSKSILSEATKPVEKKNWFKIFNDNLTEVVGVKNTKNYGNQNEFEKIDKDVQKDLDNQFNYKDEKNIDNVYGQSFLMGYYTEMKDPKNEGKTVDELKAIVAKNMAKDINYYAKNSFMGEKGIGFKQSEEPKAPKGKFKSSGYGELQEAKRSAISNEIKEIEKSNEALSLESKIKSIDEAIEKRKSKLAIAESEELAEMIDPRMIKVLQKEIKELEKYKVKASKLYEKLTGGKKQEVIDEVKESYDDMYGVDSEGENEFTKIKMKEKLHKEIEKYYGRKLASSQINTMMGKDDKIANLISKYRKLSNELT